jgi:hypothetical protein
VSRFSARQRQVTVYISPWQSQLFKISVEAVSMLSEQASKLQKMLPVLRE